MQVGADGVYWIIMSRSITIRLDDPLYAEITDAAEGDRRSMNSMVNLLLIEALHERHLLAEKYAALAEERSKARHPSRLKRVEQ